MSDSVRIIIIAEEELKTLIQEILHLEIEQLEQKLLATTAQKLIGNRLRKKDVAELLGVSAGTVGSYVKKGILPQPKPLLGGRAYWEKEEVVAAIKANDLNWKYKL